MSIQSDKRKLWVAGTVLLIAACPGAPRSEEEIDAGLQAVTQSSLGKFASPEEFDAYIDSVRDLQPRGWGLFGCASGEPRAASENAGAAPDESITNNQEAGVDEGGIVKAAGDFFIVLRRGRLFSVRHTDQGNPTMAAVSQVDASPPGFTQGSWYDELLVHQDRVILVGYSYGVGATEIGLFRLAADGQLSHEQTYFLSSNDYYSSRNYASRLVGDQLIFYMPYYLPTGGYRDQGPGYPSVRKWEKGDRLSSWREILTKVETYRPVQQTLYPTLHTVVQCTVGEGLECSARGVIGPYSRNFYVTADSVYLWVGSEWRYRRGDEQAPVDAVLYRMPLAEGGVTAVRSRGAPIDQFSFAQAEDKALNVLVRHTSGGDAMWHPEVASGDLTLVKVPPDAFTAGLSELGPERYTRMPGPSSDSYGLRNRFVGQHLLYGAGSGYSRTTTSSELFVAPVANPTQVTTLQLAHDTERLEVLGAGAAVVGTSGADLLISAIKLDGQAPTVHSTYTRPDAMQGESRSHGFFFKPDGTGGGVLGLPIRLTGNAWSHLRYGSAEVIFVRVASDLALDGFGALAASDTSVDDACEVSCSDWYGNARPIFFRGRTFALLGYELVEGAAGAQGVAETGRLTFLQERAQ